MFGIFYTGGTTGRSKGVMLSHGNILANLENVLLVADPDAHVYLHAAPMFHLADLGSTFALTHQGHTHAMVSRFDPVETLRAIEEFRVNMMMLVPTMINMLVHHPRVGDFDLSSLMLISYGASPMPPAVLERAFSVFPRVKFMQGYGMTELSPLATFLAPEYHALTGPNAGKLASAGRPVGSVELKIVGEHGSPMAAGEVGEVLVRGPNVMQGYWKRADLTAQVLRDGWLHTGDAGYLDADGFLYVVDRVKDMVITGGENVYSVEVEATIYAHPAVAMCAVIGIPSEAWGESVHAIVVRKPEHPLGAEELMAFCRERIAGYKCPRSVSFRDEPLPISGAGKILKSELRAPFWAGRGRQVN